MKTRAAALAIAALAGPAFAENWYPYFMVPSGVAYVDKDSIIFRDGHVTARTESTFPKPQSLQRDGKIFVFTKAKDLVDIDCVANVYRYVGRDLYNDSGIQQLSINASDDPMRIGDNTPEDVLAKALCPGAKRR